VRGKGMTKFFQRLSDLVLKKASSGHSKDVGEGRGGGAQYSKEEKLTLSTKSEGGR